MRASGSPEAQKNPGPARSAYPRATSSTGPVTSGSTSAGGRSRAASRAGAVKSHSVTCSMKSAGSPGFNVSPAPRSRISHAARGRSMDRRCRISRASEKVVGSAAAGPLETALVPPRGTSTSTSARARRTPAA